jgi:uncharacterized peroxidase-related enzyme
MPRIQPLHAAHAQGKAKDLLGAVKAKLGGTPNLITTMAQAPAVLEGYMGLSGALAGGSLPTGLREQVALAIAGVNSCGYCASAHTAIGKGAGVPATELAAALDGEPSDPRAAGAVRFARAVTEQRGHITDEQFRAVRAAGFTDAEVLELIAAVALNTLTNYINHIAQTEIDFPTVRLPQPVGA